MKALMITLCKIYMKTSLTHSFHGCYHHHQEYDNDVSDDIKHFFCSFEICWEETRENIFIIYKRGTYKFKRNKMTFSKSHGY